MTPRTAASAHPTPTRRPRSRGRTSRARRRRRGGRRTGGRSRRATSRARSAHGRRRTCGWRRGSGTTGSGSHDWAFEDAGSAGRCSSDEVAQLGAVIGLRPHARTTCPIQYPGRRRPDRAGARPAVRAVARRAGRGLPRAACTRSSTSSGTALARAREAAGDRNISVMGADVGRQLMNAGAIDEISIHVVPVLFGSGTPMFADGVDEHVTLELARGDREPARHAPALPRRPRRLTPRRLALACSPERLSFTPWRPGPRSAGVGTCAGTRRGRSGGRSRPDPRGGAPHAVLDEPAGVGLRRRDRARATARAREDLAMGRPRRYVGGDDRARHARVRRPGRARHVRVRPRPGDDVDHDRGRGHRHRQRPRVGRRSGARAQGARNAGGPRVRLAHRPRIPGGPTARTDRPAEPSPSSIRGTIGRMGGTETPAATLEEARARSLAAPGSVRTSSYASAAAERPLEAEDLERFAKAAYWIGDAERSISIREAAYAAFSDRGDDERAALCALTLRREHADDVRTPSRTAWLTRAERC